MGKRSRQANTGLDEEGRVKRALEKNEIDKAERARQARLMLEYLALQRKKQAERRAWVRAP